MNLALVFALALAQGTHPSEPVPSQLRVDATPDAVAFDLHLSGLPLAGETLALEVRGPVGSALQLRIDVVLGAESISPAPGILPGARAAGAATRIAALRMAHTRVLVGRTDEKGAWSTSFEAPPAGTRLLVRGFARGRGGVLAEFEALELDLLPAHAPCAGELALGAFEVVGGVAFLELVNQSPYRLDLGGAVLSDDRAGLHVFAELVLPARATRRVACDTFQLDPDATELRLADAAGRPLGTFSLVGPGASVGGSTPLNPGQGVRPCSLRADEPDLDFTDTNCDGIDGDIARAVFVATTGSAFNPGTPEAPLSDVNAAIQLAAAAPDKDHVYVSEGTYSGLVTLQDGVSVFGAYSAANGWQRSNAFVTTFNGGGNVAGNLVGLRGVNLASPLTLGNVTVTTGTAPSNGHNYGILLENGSDVRLEGVTVVAGSGGLASAGATGGGGSSGSNGSAGGSGSYKSGGNGGSGAYGGGKGGTGGDLNPSGSDGSDGGGSGGGGGGSGGGIGSNGSSGGTGAAGGAGSAGTRGSNLGAVVGGLWVSNGNGNTGGSGGSGRGGGGGGGGGITFLTGGGGGGGGGGGFGAAGGTGGKAGGSSFALFLVATNVSLDSCNLTAGLGRTGGNGGVGGTGGNGGNGGNGASDSNATDGGKGGKGGKGGDGGTGGGGGGGNSYALLVDALSTYLTLDTLLSVSAAGAGGTGGQSGLPGEAVMVREM